MKETDFKKPVLDIGNPNEFGKEIAKQFNFPYNHTIGDFDTISWMPKEKRFFKTVMCFEVIEHLMNPYLFMYNLKKHLYKDSLVFISYPRHLLDWFWSETHFHEYSDKRFKHLISAAGFEIVKKESYNDWPDMRIFFKGKKIGRFWIPGIRPMLKLLSGYWLLQVPKQKLYILKLSNVNHIVDVNKKV